MLGRAWKNGLKVGLIKTAPGVEPSARREFNPGYRFYQADSILGSFYEGAGVAYDGEARRGNACNRSRGAAARQTGWPTWARA